MQAPTLTAPKTATSGTTGASFVNVLKSTVRSEGVRGLYRGFGAVILGGTPGTILYLTSYEKIKTELEEKTGGQYNFAIHFGSGILAEAVSCVVYVPVDVCKERLQIQTNNPNACGTIYKGSVDAFVKISRQEGLAGIYKGYGATILSYGPFSAFYFLFYESLKKNAKEKWGKESEKNLPFNLVVATSAAAGE